MADFFLPTAHDADILRRFLARESQRSEGGEGFNTDDGADIQTPDIYVAVPPCGQGIPARKGDTPGKNECCIYVLEKKDVRDDDSDGVLKPVLMPNDQILRRMVYNIYERAVGTGTFYIRILRDKYGLWCNEYPNEGSTADDPDDPSNTTTLPPGSVGDPTSPCQGVCKFVWHGIGGIGYWQLVDQACRDLGTTTSTTTTTTAGPGTTTTTTPSPEQCERCPTSTTTTTTTTTAGPGTSTTIPPTTSTTTTTTPDPGSCTECVYPSYCGNNDGECTFTSCTSGKVEPTVNCTTTTTPAPTTLPPTTCDCNTTTTLSPEDQDPQCQDGCDWVWWPDGGWHLVSHGCGFDHNGRGCPCDYPADPPGGDCDATHTDCILPTDPGPPGGGSCTGSCIYWWIPTLEAWVQTTYGCSWFDVDGCYCNPPSFRGSECGPTEEWCKQPLPPPTDPKEPVVPGTCEACYTTTTTSTTTTTTTPAPCTGGCLWGWDGTQWGLHNNDCFPCFCYPPSFEGRDTCQTAMTPCVGGTTTDPPPTTTPAPTTTTSTTTTTTCPPDNTCTEFPDSNCICYQNMNPDPDGAPNWQVSNFDPACQSCVPSPPYATCLDELNSITTLFGCDVACFTCEQPTTTTTTTTTTTPPPGTCNFICTFDGFYHWMQGSGNCSMQCCQPTALCDVDHAGNNSSTGCVPNASTDCGSPAGSCLWECRVQGGGGVAWEQTGDCTETCCSPSGLCSDVSHAGNTSSADCVDNVTTFCTTPPP